MQGLQAHDWGAGQVLKRYAAKLYDASFGKPDIDAIDLAQPLAALPHPRSRPTGSTTTAT